MTNKSISSIRNQMLKRTGKKFTPKSKHLVVPAELLDIFPKTRVMKLIEYRYSIRIEEVIFQYSLNELVYRYGRLHTGKDVDRSTWSKWRKMLRTLAEAREYNLI